MQLLDRILVAVDGSGETERLVQVLLNLPCYQRASVTLLHAIAPQISAEQMSEKQAKGRQILADSLQLMLTKPDVTVSACLVEGDPKAAVLQVAEEIDATLLVMGARSMSRLMAIFQNSVGQYVFQLTKRPLLLVRDGISATPISRVMVAVDGSDAAQQALDIAIAMVRYQDQTQIILARVEPSLEVASHKPDVNNPEKDDPVLAAAVSQLKREKLTYRVMFSVGEPGREISRLSGESGADLLVMGSPDRRPTIAQSLPDLERLLGKSVSDYVRVHAQCPVLMIRPRA